MLTRAYFATHPRFLRIADQRSGIYSRVMDPDPLVVLRVACELAGSQAAWAREVGLSPQYVTDILAGRRRPTDHVLGLLGLRRVERFAWADRPPLGRGTALESTTSGSTCDTP